MIETLPLDALTPLELDRRARSLEAQLRRGVANHRVEPMLTALGTICARLGRPLRPEVVEGARARARPSQPGAAELAALRPARGPVRLEERPIDELDVSGLLALHRALGTTSRPPERVQALDRRAREIERLLGGTPREYGQLRAAVRKVEQLIAELGMADLPWAERCKASKGVVAHWAQGIGLVNRILARTQYEGARAHVLDAWRSLVAGSRERWRMTAQGRHGPLDERERQAWIEAHRRLELDLPYFE